MSGRDSLGGRWLRISVIGEVLLVLTLGTACGDDESDGSSGGPASYATVSEPRYVGGDSGAIVGTLIVHNGCVVLDDGVERWVPVFPAEATRWDGDVLMSRSLRLEFDTEMMLGGGEGGDGGAIAPPGARIPDECGDGPFWVVHAPE